MDIHAEKGMQCADCHFAQDSHGSGLIMGEVANAVEIGCKDCHGTIGAYPTLQDLRPGRADRAAPISRMLRNQDGTAPLRMGRRKTAAACSIQRSIVGSQAATGESSLVKDIGGPCQSRLSMQRAARAKLMSRTSADGKQFAMGSGCRSPRICAHKDSEMACFACHTSWTTSCGGCHLPIEANWKTDSHKYEGQTTRNYATYNPQVARDDMFQLGIHSTVKGNEIAPVRSSSALVLSVDQHQPRPHLCAAAADLRPSASPARPSRRISRIRCARPRPRPATTVMSRPPTTTMRSWPSFCCWAPISSISSACNAWTGLEGGIEAVRVTEWSEPQAVFGSYLQKYAYPDYYKAACRAQSPRADRLAPRRPVRQGSTPMSKTSSM